MDDLGRCGPTGIDTNALWQIQSTCLTFCLEGMKRRVGLWEFQRERKRKDTVLTLK